MGASRIGQAVGGQTREAVDFVEPTTNQPTATTTRSIPPRARHCLSPSGPRAFPSTPPRRARSSIMSDAHASDDDVANQPAAPASEQGDTPRDTVEDIGLGDDDNDDDDDDDLFGDGGDGYGDDEPSA
jgi:hypothetical protein